MVSLSMPAGKSQSETREKDFFLRKGGRRMSGNGGAKGTLTSIELSMILGEVYGGCEFKAEARTACLGCASGAEAEREAWFGFHWGALKLDLRSGNGGGRGRVLRGGIAGAGCGGGGGWKAFCVEGAVRGRSRLTRSAKDGAVGGTTGNAGIGSSRQRSATLVCLRQKGWKARRRIYLGRMKSRGGSCTCSPST